MIWQLATISALVAVCGYALVFGGTIERVGAAMMIAAPSAARRQSPNFARAYPPFRCRRDSMADETLKILPTASICYFEWERLRP